MHRRTSTSIALLRTASPIVTALAIVTLIAASGLATACGGGGEEDAAAGRQAHLEELRQEKQELDQARQELADLQVRLAEIESGEIEPAAEEGAAEGAEDEIAEGAETEAAGETDPLQMTDPEELRSVIETRDEEITEMAEQLNADLVAFINEDPPIQGEPLSEDVQEAFALKADEDMILAKEYITQGGDYARAISMYEDILRLPLQPEEEQRVQTALEEAQDLRYMDEERFARVEKGMTQREVREILGPVNRRNSRDYPERGLFAWFYPRSPAGDAAAVYFRKKEGTDEVYRTEFNAITKEEAEQR